MSRKGTAGAAEGHFDRVVRDLDEADAAAHGAAKWTTIGIVLFALAMLCFMAGGEPFFGAFRR